MYNLPPEVSFFDKVYNLCFGGGALNVIGGQFDKHGDTYSLQSSLVDYDLIFTKDPELTKHVMQKKHRYYEKSLYQTKMLGKYLGKGLLTNTGADWQRQRRLIQPGFNKNRIESLRDSMLSEIRSFVEGLPKNEKMDLYPLFNRLAFDIVAKSLFSSDISESEKQVITEALTISQKTFTKETIHPIVEYVMVKSGAVAKALKKVEEVRCILHRLIDHRRHDEPKGDLLDMMLEVRYEDTGMPMDDQQLVDELLILFTAGHETTANALSFIFYLLGTHPKITDALVLESKNLDAMGLELGALFSPSLADNVIREAMRLYPPVWTTDRQALEDDEFRDYSWSEGTIVMTSLYHMNRDEQRWERANEFIPSRFDNSRINDMVLIPFGSGPRYCIGEHFARMEMMLLLWFFYSRCRFRVIEESMRIEALVTLRPNRVVGEVTSAT